MKLVNIGTDKEKEERYINAEHVKLVKVTHLGEVMVVVGGSPGDYPLKSSHSLQDTLRILAGK